MAKGKIYVLALAALICLSAAALAYSADGGPGSEADPVVTKSYVDQKLASASASVFTPLEIKEGRVLIGAEGAEVILRSGEAFVVSAAENGVSDLTAGADLASGTAIALNHLLLAPRGDGRGLRAATDAWVMVKGGYELQ
ncbi:MAG: hypothetical protein LBG71_07300 [Clostridiales Family XIII bacterium]|nr:hypothetical protein [Clostridiales Family XIII bacterium]